MFGKRSNQASAAALPARPAAAAPASAAVPVLAEPEREPSRPQVTAPAPVAVEAPKSEAYFHTKS